MQNPKITGKPETFSLNWRHLLFASCLLSLGCDPFTPPALEEPAALPVKGTVELGYTQSLSQFNPLLASAQNPILTQLYWPLFHAKKDGQLDGALAQSISLEGQRAIIELRPGLTWSDGMPMSAEDIQFSWQTWQKYSPAQSLAAGITALEILSPLKVALTLEKDERWRLALSQLPLVPYHAWQVSPPESLKSITDAVTGGPFMVSEKGEDGSLKLVPNLGYPQAIQPLVEVEFTHYSHRDALLTAARDGGVDYMVGVSPKAAKSIANMSLQTALDGTLSFIAWDTTQKPFDNLAVRKGLTQAINREALIEQILWGFGRVATSPIPSNTYAHQHQSPLAFDQAQALAHLAEGGIVDKDEDGWLDFGEKNWLIELLIDEDNTFQGAVAAALRQNYREIGVQVVVRPIPAEEFFTLARKRGFDGMLLSLKGGDHVGLDFFHSQGLQNGVNFTGFSNPTLDALIDGAKGEQSAEKALPKWAEAQDYIHQNLPYTPLFERQRLDMVSADLTTPSNRAYPLDDLWRWTIISDAE